MVKRLGLKLGGLVSRNGSGGFVGEAGLLGHDEHAAGLAELYDGFVRDANL